MAEHTDLGVLFINVGWSETYDGRSLPSGNHAWLRGDRAQDEGSADACLFKSSRGRHQGPIGPGMMPKFQRLDVVFTARARVGDRRIVALFRNCEVRPHHDDPEFQMVFARAEDVLCLPLDKRPHLKDWPGRMGLRRWASGGPGKNWTELRDAYDTLIAAHRDATGISAGIHASARGLHEATIFLALGAERVDEGRYETRKAWTAAGDAWRKARADAAAMPIVFGDASYDSGNLFRWGVIDTLDVSPEGTCVTWSDVRPLHNHVASELVKVSDGQRVAREIRRGYSVVRTPAFLARSSTGATMQELAIHRADLDVEHDPLAYETMLRRLRRHQSRFRMSMLVAYGNRCAISDVNVETVLEAAHIDPHAEHGDNRTDNGLLLRSDLHALFDEGVLAIEPETLRIHLAEGLRATTYGKLHGTTLCARVDGGAPDDAALRRRWNKRKDV